MRTVALKEELEVTERSFHALFAERGRGREWFVVNESRR